MGSTDNRARTRRVAGFTLIELLLVLAITALLFSAVLPKFQSGLARRESQAAVQLILHGVRFARQAAMARGQIITICMSNAQGACIDNGQAGREVQDVLVFYDADADRKFGDKDQLLRRLSRLASGQMRWRLSNRSYLRFNADGSAREFGSIRYCMPSGSYAIAVNLYGRLFAEMKPISC